MKNRFGVALLIMTLWIVGSQLTGQESSEAQSPSETEAAESDSAERRSPLPTYYGMIGVSDEQREKLYEIQDRYEVKLEALREQLKALVRERDAELEKELTPGQRLRIAELREEARKRAEQRAAERREAAEAEAAETP